MSDSQFTIMFIMALAFIIANDYVAFFMWYALYKESLTVTWMLWDQWTFIFIVFYIVIRILATRLGWNSRSKLLGGDR